MQEGSEPGLSLSSRYAAWLLSLVSPKKARYQGDQESDSKMADSVQVEEPQRRAVGGTITTGRIHKGNDLDDQPYVIQ